MTQLSRCALALGFLLAFTPGLQAEHWTAVASTGAVDELTIGNFAFGSTSFGYSAVATTTSPIIARYNVTNTSGQEKPAWNTLELGYFDNWAGAQVTAQFYQVNPCTGARTPICPAPITSADSATSTCRTCTFGTTIDFGLFLYYVEVTVDRSAVAQTPQALTLRIF